MSARTERVLLLLALSEVGDPLDVLSWRVDGRRLTAEEVRLLVGMSEQDAEDVLALRRLDEEVGGS